MKDKFWKWLMAQFLVLWLFLWEYVREFLIKAGKWLLKVVIDFLKDILRRLRIARIPGLTPRW